MAERLTRNNKVNFYFHDEASNMVYYKLQDLEDIMEKYGIESVEELERHLSYTIDYDIISKLEYERDTWQKACELACEREDDCYVYDNIYRAYEFYQQAKKEGNDE